MALFTDGPISSIEDLRAHDTQIAEIASVEGIDVTKKLALAQEEVAIELMAFLGKLTLNPGGVMPRWCGLGLDRVVVTPPLKQWHTFRSLELFYRDAFHSQLNDRYGSRRDEYGEMAKWAREKTIQAGLGMTPDPIPQAATPNVRAVSGALPDGTYYVGMSWVNARGEEGACSNPAKITTSGSSIEVTPGVPPANATGWHVYLGNAPGSMTRQNGAAVSLASTWTEPDIPVNGQPAGSGQSVQYVQAIARLIDRG
jgi:hypothetical protein